MGRYLVVTCKSWNIENYDKLVKRFPEETFDLITEKGDLTYERVAEFKPDYVFFPHWSWIIPKCLYDNFECIVFHMTDLPFGRGGSPLQNLIVRGIYDTKISALKVNEGIDCGDIFFKESVNISEGNVDFILRNVSDIVFEKMIPKFITEEVTAVPQEGEIVEFKRRTPAESEIPEGLNGRKLYDFIRMLDGEGYPNAYVFLGENKISFKNATLDDDIVKAEVEITRIEK